MGDRARIIESKGYTVISDCYNANPNSTSAALDSLAELSGRRVCILGDMLELGENTAKLHRDVGRHAAQQGVDLIITCGELSRHTYDGAVQEGGRALHFDSKDTLMEKLSSLILPGDSILVKASHSMAFEDFVRALTEA